MAIPHTYPEHNIEIAVTIAVPKNPVVFYNMGDPKEALNVYVIVCLSLKKMDDSIKMLSSLMTFFGNENNVKKVMKCKDPAEVIKVITESCKAGPKN